MRQAKKPSESAGIVHNLHKSHSIFIVTVAVIMLLIVVIFLLLGRQSLDNSVIFLYSDRCSVCISVEPEIKQIAAESGMKFYKIKYNEPSFTPSIILLHNDTMLISGYKDGQSLKQQICGFTKLKRACTLAGENWQ